MRNVQVRHTTTRELREVKTDEGGEYTVPNLAPGNYRLIIEKEGFRRLDERGVTLQIDQTARLDIVLQVGSVSRDRAR